MQRKLIKFSSIVITLFLIFSPGGKALECYKCDGEDCNEISSGDEVEVCVFDPTTVLPPTSPTTPTTVVTPSINETSPSTNGTTPSTNGTTPSSNGTTPSTDETTPFTNGTSPSTNTTIPSSNTTTPIDNTTITTPIPEPPLNDTGRAFFVHNIKRRNAKVASLKCLKVVYIGAQNKTYTKRGCVTVDDAEEERAVCSKAIGTTGEVSACALCDSDKCNPAGRASTSILALLLPAMVVFKLLS